MHLKHTCLPISPPEQWKNVRFNKSRFGSECKRKKYFFLCFARETLFAGTVFLCKNREKNDAADDTGDPRGRVRKRKTADSVRRIQEIRGTNTCEKRCGNAEIPMRFAFPCEPNGASPKRDCREKLVGESDVTPNDFKPDLAEEQGDGKNRD